MYEFCSYQDIMHIFCLVQIRLVVQFSRTKFLSHRRSRDSLIIIAHLFSFVKRFFESFLSFFKLFLSLAFDSVEVRVACFQQLLYYSTSLFVCQEVFQKFLKFFSIFSFKPLSFPDSCSPRRASPRRLA